MTPPPPPSAAATRLDPGLERKAVVAAARTVILVGNPNVGKSVLFGALTGKYVTVSNYPGTTVEAKLSPIAVCGSFGTAAGSVSGRSGSGASG